MGLLLGVHTILCLGHRSLRQAQDKAFLVLETRVAKGSVSLSPKECWSVPCPTPRHPSEPVQIVQPFAVGDDWPSPLGRQISASSVRWLPARRICPSGLAAHTTPQSIICAQSPHLTLGTLRVFKQFSTPEPFSGWTASPSAPVRVMQTIGLHIP